MAMKVINADETCKNIKRRCKEKGLKVSEIQAALGLGTSQSIYKWFSNKFSGLPSIDHLVMLAVLLDCKVDDLLVLNDLH